MAITIEDKYREARRELGYRRDVYRRLVNGGRMTANEAKRRIDIMAAIVADYERLLQDEAEDRAGE